jgi:hypothetical protein
MHQIDHFIVMSSETLWNAVEHGRVPQQSTVPNSG